jgi:hypothetical protein
VCIAREFDSESGAFITNLLNWSKNDHLIFYLGIKDLTAKDLCFEKMFTGIDGGLAMGRARCV